MVVDRMVRKEALLGKARVGYCKRCKTMLSPREFKNGRICVWCRKIVEGGKMRVHKKWTDEVLTALLKEFEATPGAKVKDFCKEKGVPDSTFYIFRKRHRDPAMEDGERASMIGGHVKTGDPTPISPLAEPCPLLIACDGVELTIHPQARGSELAKRLVAVMVEG